jgi:chitinase
LLSIGGPPSDTTNYKVSSVDKGIEFAEFLYNSFGPYKEGWKGPRPFDMNSTEHVSVDGFDLDLEDDSEEFRKT